MEKDVSELKHLHTEKIRMRTGLAEIIRPHGISLSTDNIIVPMSPFSLASQRMYLCHAMEKRIGSVVKSLYQHVLDLEEWQFIFTAQEDRVGGISVLEANTNQLCRGKHACCDISRSQKRLTKDKCFQSIG